MPPNILPPFGNSATYGTFGLQGGGGTCRRCTYTRRLCMTNEMVAPCLGRLFRDHEVCFEIMKSVRVGKAPESGGEGLDRLYIDPLVIVNDILKH